LDRDRRLVALPAAKPPAPAIVVCDRLSVPDGPVAPSTTLLTSMLTGIASETPARNVALTLTEPLEALEVADAAEMDGVPPWPSDVSPPVLLTVKLMLPAAKIAKIAFNFDSHVQVHARPTRDHARVPVSRGILPRVRPIAEI
jgi:hypothetical protein